MIFGYISDVWNEWNIQSLVILSLSLQIFLILFAPLRKKTSNQCIFFLLWLAYLMADLVATYTIGLISHKQGNSCAYATEVDMALQVFWVSFLLLHLGGPDNITAFSLEDSSLWQRHLLTFICQVTVAIYVLVQIFLNDKSLVIPMILVLLAAIIKNVERTLALYLSSLPRLKESVIPRQERESIIPRQESESMIPWQDSESMIPLIPRQESESMIPRQDFPEDVYRELVKELDVQWHGNPNGEADLVESTVMKHAYYFFHIFKVFLGDLMFTSQQRRMSYNYFQKISPMNALRVISVELNFMYDVLHTKALTIHSKWSYIFRFIAFAAIVMAFILFDLLKKHCLPEPDVRITYYLFFGGITLDVIALSMLIFSDLTIVRIKCYSIGLSTQGSFIHWLISAMDDLRMPRYVTCEVDPNDKVTYAVLDTPFIFRRWSESISACNLFSEGLQYIPRMMYKRNQHWGSIDFSLICSFLLGMAKILKSYLHQAGETITLCCGLKKKERKIANMMYMCKNPFPMGLWIFIFKKLKRKSTNSEKVREIFEARGDLFLEKQNGCAHLLKYVREFNYEASVVIWHVATGFCYSEEKLTKSSTERNNEREFSKILSDYMLYLFLNQPKLMSTVAVAGIGQSISTEILDQIKQLIKTFSIDQKTNETFPGTSSGFEENEVRGEEQWAGSYDTLLNSWLMEGLHLAQNIRMLEAGQKWKVISGVWVEMLSYAAIHIKGETHVQVLSEGGELLAFVWVLMVHLGCFYKHEWGTSFEYQHS